jgi:soluble lytic murein transglycosylase-like protein
MPDLAIAVGAGTIHQESAWNPRAQSAYAKGLTQFTDPTWKDMVKLDPSIAQIGDVWNPHAAIRAMARYHRLLYAQFVSAPDPKSVPSDVWPFLLSGYNGGPGWVRKDQRLCASAPASTKEGVCDPSQWWGNVERFSSRAPQFIKENRHYVSNILKRWVPLYRSF